MAVPAPVDFVAARLGDRRPCQGAIESLGGEIPAIGAGLTTPRSLNLA